MNISISETVFPSYTLIRNKIIQQQHAKYQHKIEQLSSHLASMQAAHDFKHEHEQIKHAILTFAPPPEPPSFLKDPLKLEPTHKTHPSGQINSESLNYYVADDSDSANNYETFLKFRKKTLQRDLQEEEMERHENKGQKRKEKQEDQEFFKNLYVAPQKVNHLQNKANIRVKTANSKHVQFQWARENAALFMSSLAKANPRGTCRKSCGVRKKGGGSSKVHQADGRSTFHNNRKYLTENYLQILKKLQNTNIVKLRVLKPQP